MESPLSVATLFAFLVGCDIVNANLNLPVAPFTPGAISPFTPGAIAPVPPIGGLNDVCNSGVLGGIITLLRLRIGLLSALPHHHRHHYYDDDDDDGHYHHHHPDLRNLVPGSLLDHVLAGIADPALKSLLAMCIPGAAIFPPKLAAAALLPTLLGPNAGLPIVPPMPFPVPGTPMTLSGISIAG